MLKGFYSHPSWWLGSKQVICVIEWRTRFSIWVSHLSGHRQINRKESHDDHDVSETNDHWKKDVRELVIVFASRFFDSFRWGCLILMTIQVTIWTTSPKFMSIEGWLSTKKLQIMIPEGERVTSDLYTFSPIKSLSVMDWLTFKRTFCFDHSNP